MAYVLGFFVADGSMFVNSRGSCYIDFTSIDKDLIEAVRKMMDTDNSIGAFRSTNPKRKISYRLQIGSKEIFKDLLELGLTPCKSKKLKLPNIPSVYLSDFTRGYFDGDGCVCFNIYRPKDRKNSRFYFTTRFSCGSEKFLRDLLKQLQKNVGIKGGCIIKKKDSASYDLQFSVKDSFKLYEFMYKNVKNIYFLRRKYNIFQKAIKHYGGVA